MKHFLITLAIFTLGTVCNAQTSSMLNDSKAVKGFNASIVNANLMINWAVAQEATVNYWEVQGSVDGKSFTTIGMVMGGNPSQTANHFTFKQQISKLKPGMKYYRVLHIENDDTAIASDIIQSVK